MLYFSTALALWIVRHFRLLILYIIELEGIALDADVMGWALN